MSFVGTVAGSIINTDRKAFLDAFRRECPLFVKSGDYVPVFNRSRLVLNQSAAGEVNFRVFQAMACGAALVTEDTGNGLCELFEPRARPVGLSPGAGSGGRRPGPPGPGPGKCRGPWAVLAARGRDTVLAGHTTDARARPGSWPWARRLAAQGAPRKRLSALERIRPMLANALLHPGQRRGPAPCPRTTGISTPVWAVCTCCPERGVAAAAWPGIREPGVRMGSAGFTCPEPRECVRTGRVGPACNPVADGRGFHGVW